MIAVRLRVREKTQRITTHIEDARENGRSHLRALHSSTPNHSFMVAERGFVEQLRSSGLAKALVEEVEQFIKWCVDSCCCRRQRRDLRPLGSRTIADRVRDSKLYPPR